MRPYLWLSLLLTACGGAGTAAVEQPTPDADVDAQAVPEAAPAADAGPSDSPGIMDVIRIEAAIPDAGVQDSWTAEVGPPDAAPPDAPPDAVPVESGPPTYTANCLPGTPWVTVCSLPDGGACAGHTWVCSTDGGVLADEYAPNVGQPLSWCSDTGDTFCCCQ